MINQTSAHRRAFAFTGLLAVVGSTSLMPVAIAQTTRHKPNILQRHRHIASGVAGIAAYKAAKHTGKNRAAAGRKRNFAQRHPYLTGAAAAVGTHHLLKKKR